MDWLGSWLKSIILVILLATFVDILLPNQTMQRYVKTVMSLFILLTLLQPIFSLFQKNTSIDQLLAQTDTMFKGSSSKSVLTAFSPQQGGATDMQSLGSIQQHAEQLKIHQEQQSQRLVQQQITDLMKRNIEQTASVRVLNLTVETGKDANGQLQIRNVHVQAATQPKPASSQQEPSGSMKPMTVDPIKPVNITIDPKEEPVFSSRRDTPDKSPDKNRHKETDIGATTSNTQEQTQIKMLLNKEWQVPLEHIVVDISDGKLKY